MEEYENMVEIIKKEYSNAKLVIGEILPRYYHERLKTAELEQKRCQFNFPISRISDQSILVKLLTAFTIIRLIFIILSVIFCILIFLLEISRRLKD
jgi:hypothetical protein